MRARRRDRLRAARVAVDHGHDAGHGALGLRHHLDGPQNVRTRVHDVGDDERPLAGVEFSAHGRVRAGHEDDEGQPGLQRDGRGERDPAATRPREAIHAVGQRGGDHLRDPAEDGRLGLEQVLVEVVVARFAGRHLEGAAEVGGRDDVAADLAGEPLAPGRVARGAASEL